MELISCADILHRISDYEGTLKINSMVLGSLFIQESRWLLALTRFPKTVRAHIRPKNLGTTNFKIPGKICEPMLEIFQREDTLVNSALNDRASVRVFVVFEQLVCLGKHRLHSTIRCAGPAVFGKYAEREGAGWRTCNACR